VLHSLALPTMRHPRPNLSNESQKKTQLPLGIAEPGSGAGPFLVHEAHGDAERVRPAEKYTAFGQGRSFATAILPIILTKSCSFTERGYRRDG
jgi:hypothetical protein